MRYITFCVLCGLAFQSLLSADIFNRFYLRADGGAVLLGNFTAENKHPDLQINDLGRSWTYGGGVGYFLNKDFRLEARALWRAGMRYQYFSESVDTIDLTVGKLCNNTVTLGIYYQLFTINRSTPYIGIGGGYAHNILRDNNRLTDLDIGRATSLNDINTNSFCFFVSTGTLISLTSHWHLDLGASYFNIGHVGPILSKGVMLGNIATCELNFGLIYTWQ